MSTHFTGHFRSSRVFMLGTAVITVAAVLVAAGTAASGVQGARHSAPPAPLAHLLPPNIRAMGTITVPSSIEFPPFEYFVPGTTTATGLDIDIMNAIG